MKQIVVGIALAVAVAGAANAQSGYDRGYRQGYTEQSPPRLGAPSDYKRGYQHGQDDADAEWRQFEKDVDKLSRPTPTPVPSWRTRDAKD